jgi:hypothetical protein
MYKKVMHQVFSQAAILYPTVRQEVQRLTISIIQLLKNSCIMVMEGLVNLCSGNFFHLLNNHTDIKMDIGTTKYLFFERNKNRKIGVGIEELPVGELLSCPLPDEFF